MVDVPSTDQTGQAEWEADRVEPAAIPIATVPRLISTSRLVGPVIVTLGVVVIAD
jgi:hypothetical protein